MRPSRDEYFLAMAKLVASRATCLRRSVGCVLVSFRGHVLATGYNGVASGLPHCNTVAYDNEDDELPTRYPHACPAAAAPSGTQLDGCEAIHAEQNALLQCRDVYAIDTCYVTTPPCLTCTKLLLNTSCNRIVASGSYPQAAAAAQLWTREAVAGRGPRAWVQL